MSIFPKQTAVNAKDQFMNAYPYIKTFDNINGFTASHVSTGSFTPGWPQGTLSTGTTSGSRACIYGTNGISIYTTVPAFYTRFKMRINTATSNIQLNSFFVLGVISTPTNPLSASAQMTFRIFNGDILVASGDGATGQEVDTGYNFTQFTTWDLEFVQLGNRAEYFVNGLSVQVFTTLLPTGVILNPTLYASNSAAADKSLIAYPMMITQGP